MSLVHDLAAGALRSLDPEDAHGLTIRALQAGRGPRPRGPGDPILAIRFAGLDLPNCVGLAAGFDKNAQVYGPMLAAGFGFVECGTVTPLPQAGNPRPRLFRLTEDRAVINRMGFNNGGQKDAVARLRHLRRRSGPIGVNIGANKDAADRIADYAAGARACADVADYLTINISSPNTPGLRALQSADALKQLLHGVMPCPKPVFLKVAPDLEPDEVEAIGRVALDGGVSALIVANTTVSRPPLRSRHGGEAGGLSGAPLASLALARLRDFRGATGGALPLISAGGIGDAEEAYRRIRAGASAVQLYSALVYEGPGLARRIARGLAEHLRRDGFGSVPDAVGVES